MTEQVSKSECKAKALEFFRRSEATGETLDITDHRRPRLAIRRFPNPPVKAETASERTASLRGMILHYDDPLAPVGLDDWKGLK